MLYVVEMLLQYIYSYYVDSWCFTRFFVNFAGYPLLFLTGLYTVALLKSVWIEGHKEVDCWSCKLFWLIVCPLFANVALFYLAIMHDKNEIEKLLRKSGNNGKITTDGYFFLEHTMACMSQ